MVVSSSESRLGGRVAVPVRDRVAIQVDEGFFMLTSLAIRPTSVSSSSLDQQSGRAWRAESASSSYSRAIGLGLGQRAYLLVRDPNGFLVEYRTRGGLVAEF